MLGVFPQPSPVCSIHLDDATAATGQRSITFLSLFKLCSRHSLQTIASQKLNLLVTLKRRQIFLERSGTTLSVFYKSDTTKNSWEI